MIGGSIPSGPSNIGLEAQLDAARKLADSNSDAPDFENMLADLIKQVDSAQHAADDSIERLATGDSADIQDVVLKLEEADLTFRLMKEIRDKLVQAYKEVVSMQ